MLGVLMVRALLLGVHVPGASIWAGVSTSIQVLFNGIETVFSDKESRSRTQLVAVFMLLECLAASACAFCLDCFLRFHL